MLFSMKKEGIILMIKILSILLLSTSIANAAFLDAPFGEAPLKPPYRYTGNIFKGKIHIRRLPQKFVQDACRYLWKKFPLITNMSENGARGCSLRTLEVNNPNSHCYIIIHDKPFYKSTPILVLNHEMAHCNGWNPNHDN